MGRDAGHMERITGTQARELLDDFNNPRTSLGHVRTRPLLETLAWLYGKPADGEAEDGTEWLWKDQTILTGRGAGALAMFRGDFIGYGDEMTPDDAVDLARALLAAAEMARTM